MQRAVGPRQPLDGPDIRAVRLDGQHQAGPHQDTVDDHGAGTADAMFAAEMGACETERGAEEIAEMGTCFGLPPALHAVDRDLDLVEGRAHDEAPAARSAARQSAR